MVKRFMLYAKTYIEISILITVVMCYSLAVHRRNLVWKDYLSLWSDVVNKSPNKARPHNNLGATLQEQGKFHEAIGHLSEALRIKPDYEEAHNNLGNALQEQGKFHEAIGHYSEALRIKPDFAEAKHNLTHALKEPQKPERLLNPFPGQ